MAIRVRQAVRGKNTSAQTPYDYGQKDDYLDKIHSLEYRINEFERQQDRCDILSDRYDKLQDKMDDIQDKLDELDDYFDDDL